MFNRTTTDAQQPLKPTAPQMDGGPARRPPAKAPSILGPDLVFEGNISGDGELMIDGTVKGDIHVARLMVGEHAHVEGVLRGGQIEIRGHVHGNIEGKAVRLLETAHVEGDITHEQLSIDVGAFFQGRCAPFRPAQPAKTTETTQLIAPATVEPPAANVIELDQTAQR
jgi:cytoskeletal protein CcmA (bactofilin family)